MKNGTGIFFNKDSDESRPVIQKNFTQGRGSKGYFT